MSLLQFARSDSYSSFVECMVRVKTPLIYISYWCFISFLTFCFDSQFLPYRREEIFFTLPSRNIEKTVHRRIQGFKL